MYAYVATKPGTDFDSTREIAYWRKHPNLHGWMEQLWNKRTNGGHQDGNTFNGIEVELTREIIDDLEQHVLDGTLPGTSGFFFGNDADEHYYNYDLEFIKQARYELFMGLKVFYNSSW
jgi:hypothetical protein